MIEHPWKVSGYGISVISRPSSPSAIESWSLWAQIWTPSSTALYSLFHHFGNRAFVSPIFLTLFSHFYIVVLWLSPVQLFGTQWTAACQASLSFTIALSLLKLVSIELMMPSSHLILCCPLLLLSSISPSIRVFALGFQSIESSVSASVLPMNI